MSPTPAIQTVIQETIPDAEWDTFVRGSDYSGFMQSAAWAKVKEEEGWDYYKLALREKDRLAAVALVLAIRMNNGRTLLYSPQGPVLDWHRRTAKQYVRNLSALVEQIARREHALCWRIEPWALHSFAPQLSELQKAPVDMQPRHTALIPIVLPIEQLLATFHPKVRYNAHLAVRHGVTVQIGNDANAFETFYATYRKTVDRKSLDFKEASYFESIGKHLGTRREAFVLSAVRDGTVLASILLIRCGKRLTYFFGGFDYEQRKYMAPYLCHLEAMRFGQSLGCDFYDLWGIANTDSPEHPWHSFTEFKLKFKPVKVSLTGAYDVIFDPAGYRDVFFPEEA